MIFEDSPTIQGSNNRDVTLLGSRDKFIDGQLSRICGEDYQLCRPKCCVIALNISGTSIDRLQQ
jgi:hypothetical protein